MAGAESSRAMMLVLRSVALWTSGNEACNAGAPSEQAEGEGSLQRRGIVTEEASSSNVPVELDGHERWVGSLAELAGLSDVMCVNVNGGS